VTEAAQAQAWPAAARDAALPDAARRKVQQEQLQPGAERVPAAPRGTELLPLELRSLPRAPLRVSAHFSDATARPALLH
jgi:hypothetical protein